MQASALVRFSGNFQGIFRGFSGEIPVLFHICAYNLPFTNMYENP
jgi:hypothetical protein